MDIKIMSRGEAISFSYRQHIPRCIIISISDSTGKRPNFDRENKNIIDILYLFLDDIEEQIENFVPMSESDAERIVEFVNRHKDNIDTIIVHCVAGVSRSAGVACALSRVINGDDSWIWNSGIYAPNRHCLKTTLRAFGITPDEEEIEKLWKELGKDMI